MITRGEAGNGPDTANGNKLPVFMRLNWEMQFAQVGITVWDLV